MTVSFAQIVAHTKPKWFVMENVDRAVKSQRYRQAGEILTGAGYSLTQRILDANQCGVPQRRKRLFLIGELGLSISVGSRALASYLDNNLTVEPMTVRDYLGDSLGVAHYYRHPRNYSRRAVFSVGEPESNGERGLIVQFRKPTKHTRKTLHLFQRKSVHSQL